MAEPFSMSATELAVVAPDATRADVAAAVARARELGCGSVCVPPTLVAAAFSFLEGDATPRLTTLAGFPSGKHVSLIKASEARWAVQQGAAEVALVVDLAAAKAQGSSALISELMTVREAIPHPVMLTVIAESAALTEPELRAVVTASVKVGADCIATSTGFHPSGGASVEAVRIIADQLRELRAERSVWIKASGFAGDQQQAVDIIEAGATVISGAGLDGLT